MIDHPYHRKTDAQNQDTIYELLRFCVCGCLPQIKWLAKGCRLKHGEKCNALLRWNASAIALPPPHFNAWNIWVVMLVDDEIFF